MSEFVKAARLLSLHRHFAPGEVLCQQGDLDRDLFILVHGKLRVLRDGREVAQIVHRGSFVGEMSFLLGVPRSATVTTIEATEVIRVPAENVERFFRGAPDLGFKLSEMLAKRLLDTTASLSQAQAREERLRDDFNALFGKVFAAWRTSRSASDLAASRYEFARALDSWVEEFRRNEFLHDPLV